MPVDTEEVPDYTDVVTQPMDLSTMMGKIDRHMYSNVESFISDINLICTNALEYNPQHTSEGMIWITWLLEETFFLKY